MHLPFPTPTLTPRPRRRAALSALVVALLVALAGAVAPAGAAPTQIDPPAVTVPDPTVPGPFDVAKVDYDEGLTIVTDDSTGVTYPAELSGSVHFPSTGDGPFPLLVFLHGRHATCDLTVAEFLGYPCPETPITSNIDSYAGYDYLGELLASHGYVVVSFDANAINTFDSTGENGMAERAELMTETLDLVAAWNDGSETAAPGPALAGRVDMERLGIMGHSRGGEGVARFIDENRNRTDGTVYSLDAVFALAAVDFNDPITDGVHFAALAPLCDGDVSNLQGTQAYDRSTYDPSDEFARVQFTVRGANHNFFNTIWTNDDWGGTEDAVCHIDTDGSERLEPADQRRIGIATMTTFFRRYVGDELAFDPLMTGEAPIPASTCPVETGSLDSPVPCDQIVGVSYSAPASQRTMLFSPTDGAGATPAGFTTFAECDSDGGTACPDLNRSGNAQYTLEWDGTATLRIDVSSVDTGGGDVLTFRTTVNDDAANQAVVDGPNSSDYYVTVSDGATSFTVPASQYGTYALTDKRSPRYGQETMNGVRIPLAGSGLDLTALTEVVFTFGAPGVPSTGSVQLAEVTLQRELVDDPDPVVSEGPLPVAAGFLAVLGAVVGVRRRRVAAVS